MSHELQVSLPMETFDCPNAITVQPTEVAFITWGGANKLFIMTT